jgi:hypothetical protein
MAAATALGNDMRILQTLLVLSFSAGTLCAATHWLTVAGLGGEADYVQRFDAQAKERLTSWPVHSPMRRAAC